MNVVRKITRYFSKSVYPNDSRLQSAMPSRELLFKAPPLTRELIEGIKLITPDARLRLDENSRKLWELDQNASSWTEFEALSPLLKSLPKPSKVLEIGPGFGRSVVFLTKKLGWHDTLFHLFEGTGTKTKYTILGPRFEDSFCGNIPLLRQVLEFNGIRNFKIFDAAELQFKLGNLREKYDVIYSFYAVGFHWSLEYFIDEILSLMNEKSVAFFTIPNQFVVFEKLRGLEFKIFESMRTQGERVRILAISKDPSLVSQKPGSLGFSRIKNNGVM